MATTESVKRAMSTFVQSKVPTLVNRMFSVFPSVERYNFPFAVIDLDTLIHKKTYLYAYGGWYNGLLRVSVLSNDTHQVDELSDQIMTAVFDYELEITEFEYKNVSDLSPLLKNYGTYPYKEDIYRRDIDIAIRWYQPRKGV